MSTLIAFSPILLMIVILVIGLTIVKFMVSKNQKGYPSDLEKRVAVLEKKVDNLKNNK
ncbi:hypothetical protein [Planococcus shixiaomingii]|uniref:hypothetical protein n=1 Tax=Planococcus shixiaomingii TaxID=3058393 RepID=UPI002625AEFD|nr:hypothetical protein [Planococcus sp. N022]WKA56069.1 hypothetical protein QWY21_06920 [Planococcus sp. N022]